MSRKQIEIEAKRQFILDAARKLFAERGIDEPSMDEIAAAAEYTRQTLYVYFQSRDEILLRVLSEDLRRRWSRQKEALADVTGCVPRLRVWANVLLGYWREQPHVMRMEMFWDYHGIDPQFVGEAAMAEFASVNTELAEVLLGTLQSGVDDGSLRSGLDLEMCASQFVQCLRAATFRALSSTYSFAAFEADVYLEHFLEIFFAGIRGGVEGTTGDIR